MTGYEGCMYEKKSLFSLEFNSTFTVVFFKYAFYFRFLNSLELKLVLGNCAAEFQVPIFIRHWL
jgi:hypothetical protein